MGALADDCLCPCAGEGIRRRMSEHAFNTVERARGRWREILPAIGISAHFLSKKHGPCPLCGGKDRYRFDDREGSGSYYCNQCGAGNGIILVRKLLKCDHATACRQVDEIIGARSPMPTQDAARPSDGNGKSKR